MTFFLKFKCSIVFFLVLLTAPCLAVHVNAGTTQEENHGMNFSTLVGFEADKCASIWLIKRIIDKDAAIEFYHNDDAILHGIRFDTPSAEFRRTYNRSTYEAFLDYYELSDPGLVRIGEIIHDIEVNTWEQKRFRKTYSVRDRINTLILETSSSDELMEKTNRYFDELYQELSENPCF